MVLREGFVGDGRHLHPGVLFSGDPTRNPAAKRFILDGLRSSAPPTWQQLPDGRVLILMRTLLWPLPQRFAGRIVIGDPAAIRDGQVWQS